jgi:hypothetical protein
LKRSERIRERVADGSVVSVVQEFKVQSSRFVNQWFPCEPRFSGSVVQWFSGSVVQWFSGSVVQWKFDQPFHVRFNLFP